jgi:hypothetical protein
MAQRPALDQARETRRAVRSRSAVDIRATAVWPRFDPLVLSRCHGDAGCLARTIARRRTTMSAEDVLRILTGTDECPLAGARVSERHPRG